MLALNILTNVNVNVGIGLDCINRDYARMIVNYEFIYDFDQIELGIFLALEITPINNLKTKSIVMTNACF